VLFGLGNPGDRYAKTRHNAGWQVLDEIARQESVSFRATRFFPGDEATYREGGEVVRLVRPTTFMNLCGPAYVRVLEVVEVEPAEALVISDDFMLPFGRLRLRDGGSAGGHNGLRSIEEALASQAYPRLRLGIGPVPPPRDPADFVLERYDAEQQKGLPDLLERGAAAARLWVREGLEAAANRFNGG
jgi:PTH1 family peptidyl-tRNA hydrolase